MPQNIKPAIDLGYHIVYALIFTNKLRASK